VGERGYIFVDRGIWDHDVFPREPFTNREAWIWMIGTAVWKATRVRAGRKLVTLERGQLCFSERFLAEKWMWSKSRVRRFFDILKTEAMIETKTDHEATHITICNYNKYQLGGTTDKTTNEPDTGPPADHRRTKEEELKEVKKEIKHIGAVADATRPNAGKIFDDEFWPRYPKREGSNPRKPARDKFLIAVKSGHDPASIVGGVERYATSLAKSNQIGTRYVAQAVTWINQARWEDYQPVIVPETTGPPQPPDPSLPSHEELKLKYGQTHDGQSESTSEGTEIRGDGGNVRGGAEGGDQDRTDVADHPRKHPGVASMAQVFHRSSGLRALVDGQSEAWGSGTDDGPGAMA